MARKKSNTRIPFTEEEIQQILNTPLSNIKDLAFTLNRSYDAVRRKKWALLNKEQDLQAKKNYKQQIKQELNPDGIRKYQYWSKLEEELVLTYTGTDIDLAKELKRSLSSIQIKRARLLENKRKKTNGPTNQPTNQQQI